MMELLSAECLAAISRAAAGCDKLNYILQQKGNAALLNRMDLPLLSESKIAELSKKSYSINVCTSAAHRVDEERFRFTTNSNDNYIRWKSGCPEFQANKSGHGNKVYFDVPTPSQASDLFGTQLIIQTSNDEYEPRSTEGTLHLLLHDAPVGVPYEDNDITRLWTLPNQGSKDGQGPHVCMISIATGLGENSSIVRNLKVPKKSSDDAIARWEAIEKERSSTKNTTHQGPVVFVAAEVSKETIGSGKTIVYTGTEIDRSATIEGTVRLHVSSKTTLLVCGLQPKLAPGVLSNAERIAFDKKIPVMDYLDFNALVNGTDPVAGRKRLVSAGSGTCMLADAGVGSSLVDPKKKLINPRCSVEGCTKQVQSKGLCLRHGAPKIKCSHDGCDNGAVNNGVCIRHGATKSSSREKTKICSIEGCNNVVRSKGVCVRHGATPSSTCKKICSIEGCTNFVRSKGVCKRHGASKPKAAQRESTKSKPLSNPKSMSSSVAKGTKLKSSTTSSSGKDTATSNTKKASKPMPSSSSSSSTCKSSISALSMTSSGTKRKGGIQSNPRSTQAPRVSLDEQQVTSSSAQAVSVSTSAQASSMSGQGATGNKKKKQVKLGAFFEKEEE